MSADATTPGSATAPLRAALDGFATGLQHLIKVVDDGALNDLGTHSLMEFLQDFEQIRNMMPVIDGAAIQYGTEQGVPGVLCQRTMTQVLLNGLRLSAGEACRRVKAAEHLADRRSMTGEPLGPFRPHLAQAQRDGEITPEQVTVIDGALRKVDHLDPAQVDAGEKLLVDNAAKLDVSTLRLVAQQVVDAIDPDGTLPEEREHHRRRFVHLRQRSDGSWHGEFRLTPELGQKLQALLEPLMRPKTTQGRIAADDDTELNRRTVDHDDRSQGQRRHDALEDAVDRQLRSADLPESGGTPTTLLIHLSYQEFISGQGTGRYADGTPVSVRTIAELAGEAEVAWCVKSRTGAVLQLHRSRRIASPAQTLALIARDGGCSFPGCTTRPEWCERHHIVAWQDGGSTNLDNLTLLCRYHHHNFEQRGWTCQLNPDRLPVWIPPPWIDRHQRPILNPRITISNWDPQDPLDLA
ncbi:MAG: HNH endonuclease [Microlunatus sp.]|nr:HNH endonuclease [Microlunatus sp.]